MFSDPQTVTIGGAAKALVKVNQDNFSSEYLLMTSTDEHRLRIRNTSYKDKVRGVMISRHNVELTVTIFAVAPATVSTVRKFYCVLENQQGDTLADPALTAEGICNWLIASNRANLLKLMNFES